MSDQERNFKDKDDKSCTPKKLTIMVSKPDNEKDKLKTKVSDVLPETTPHPTIILKARDNEAAPSSSNVHLHRLATTKPILKRDTEVQTHILKAGQATPKPSIDEVLSDVPQMQNSARLIDNDGQFWAEGLSDYLSEQTDYLVIGCIGLQGVGKSTIMSHLASVSPNLTEDSKNSIFKVETLKNVESCTNCTYGVELYVSKNRILFLDTGPISSPALMDKLTFPEGKRGPFSSSQISGGDFLICNSIEVYSLQIAAFILSVCHVVILMQDWFTDANVLRFMQSAEMLKPPMPTTCNNETLTEYFPHVIFLHNKAQYSDFTNNSVFIMQEMYSKVFMRSHLQITNGITSAEGTGSNVSVFLIPDFTDEEDDENNTLGQQKYLDAITKLKKHLFGIEKSQLTHTTLTEKNWLQYSVKVWETIQKSSFFHEYEKLLP